MGQPSVGDASVGQSHVVQPGVGQANGGHPSVGQLGVGQSSVGYLVWDSPVWVRWPRPGTVRGGHGLYSGASGCE